jgi:hypothetical protein
MKPDRSPPKLRFSPTAWAKLLFLRDLGGTEVGGFGISAPGDLLFIEEFVLIRQLSSVVSVMFDDVAVAEFFDQQIDAGRTPEQFGRIWIHTHPGDCARPSGTDEETFARVFGRSDWAVMAIVACGGQSYARLRFSVGPGGERLLPIEVDYRNSFSAADHEAWSDEYLTCVEPVDLWRPVPTDCSLGSAASPAHEKPLDLEGLFLGPTLKFKPKSLPFPQRSP